MTQTNFWPSGRTIWNLLLGGLLVAVLGRFMIVGMAKLLFNSHSSDGDESAYLSLGLALAEEGRLTDGTRPPLYPLLLAPVAERSWAYFTWAKLITLGLGALAILAAFEVGRRLFDVETALLAAFLLGANREFHLRASTVYADTLLVGLFVAAWYFLIKSFNSRRARYLAGFFVGLAYLTKSTATLLLVAWAAVALVHYRHKILAQRQLLVPPLLFLLTASPLLLYNWNQFGQPFYSFATTHVMWMDRWAESQVADPADLPTLTSYLQSHTPAQMVTRLWRGIEELNPVLAETLIPSRRFEPAWLGPALLGSGLLAAGWFLIFQRPALKAAYRRYRLTLLLSLFLFGPFYLSSAWYAEVLMESRFLIPVLGPFYLLLAAGLVGLARRLRRELAGPGRWGFNAVVGAGLVWAGGWLVVTTQIDSWSLTVDPFESDRQANTQAEMVLDWLITDFPPHAAAPEAAPVVFGPSKSLPLWKFPPRFNFQRLPVEVETWSRLETYLTQSQPRYIIIDSDTARRRREALGQYFIYDDQGIEFEQVPPGWTLRYLHDPAPHTWVIFSPVQPPARPVSAQLGQQFALLGYDLQPRPDRGLDVTLYWQALEVPAQDYTIFLHLTAPDGFVKAQRDRPPFDGLWPTGRWTPGAVMADRFELPLDQSVQPGRYLLLTGLYQPQTGQRLPLTSGPAGPTPDTILLGEVSILE